MKREACDNLDRQITEEDLDESLMEAVAHCLADDVRRFAMARCGDRRGDVDDIIQDAMMAAQRYLKGFRGEASLRTWMNKLVLSACSHNRRGRKNDPAIHRELDDLGETAAAEDPEVSVMVSERLEVLHRAIEGLRPEDQELLAAVEWEGLSLHKAGERFGLTVPAMKSRMFRIRGALRESMS